MHAKQDHWSQGYKASLCSLFFSKQIKVSIEVSVERRSIHVSFIYSTLIHACEQTSITLYTM